MDSKDQGLDLFPILEEYGFKAGSYGISSLGTGLINTTWRIKDSRGDFVLQKINHAIFSNPWAIAENIRAMGEYLATRHPDYLFTRPLQTKRGEEMVEKEGMGFFRIFPFIVGSVTHDVVSHPRLAYKAARSFGRFTRSLAGLPMEQLQTTLEAFHDLSLRYQQFTEALEKGNPERIRDSAYLIDQARELSFLVNKYQSIRQDPAFLLRPTHHDTKISNVLFNKQGQALCVIDLDTVMPGYFLSDLGDMMRTYLSPVSEEEQDFSRIEVREEYKSAVLEGYLSAMKPVLSPAELESVDFAGPYIIYMQALRFLTDHLNNDRYYGAKYQGHNKQRAENQLVLLNKLMTDR
ncbi:MAG: aminoglycoside phosphotransferase family protein [Chitinophagales bacterium]|nr:aminoglycoside phosphotransferase family protein [Chitinophagales bacterium]